MTEVRRYHLTTRYAGKLMLILTSFVISLAPARRQIVKLPIFTPVILSITLAAVSVSLALPCRAVLTHAAISLQL